MRSLAEGYQPPAFGDAPGPDAALFLCAIDHRTGYRHAHLVDRRGPFEGSDLLWQLGCAAERRRPGTLSARALLGVEPETVEAMFQVGGETVFEAGKRATLWRDLAQKLLDRYDGLTQVLLDSAGARLGGRAGLLARLADLDAFADPLQKKSFLFAKIADRRGWFAPSDPESWEVCADNVLMRLALRSGLVKPDPDADTVRAATRDAFKRVSGTTGIAPNVLDDLLWELGREDPDLLGTVGGDLREPPRPDGMVWY